MSRDVILHEQVLSYKEDSEQIGEIPLPIAEPFEEIEAGDSNEENAEVRDVLVNTEENDNIAVRRSQIESTRLGGLNDYVTAVSTNSNYNNDMNQRNGKHYNFVAVTLDTIKRFRKDHVDFMGNIYQICESTSYTQASSQTRMERSHGKRAYST